VSGENAYDWKKLVGWIDIDRYFGPPTYPRAPSPKWLMGWWEVRAGNETLYYYFSPVETVYYSHTKPMNNSAPYLAKSYTGEYRFDIKGNVTIKWADEDYPDEIFRLAGGSAPVQMTGRLFEEEGMIPYTAIRLD
jgi:hypothetical protein